MSLMSRHSGPRESFGRTAVHAWSGTRLRILHCSYKVSNDMSHDSSHAGGHVACACNEDKEADNDLGVNENT